MRLDVEVDALEWFRWAEEDGATFLRKLAEAAMNAHTPHHRLLRPILIAMKTECPKPV